MLKIPDSFVNQCIETFGRDGQLDILQEECAELIKASSKLKRKPGEAAMANLIEELTHVAISSAVVAKIYGTEDHDILDEVQKKADKYGFKLDD